MAYRMTNSEEAGWKDHIHVVKQKHDELFAQIVEYNSKIAELFTKVSAAQDAYDEARGDAAGFLEDIHREHDETFVNATEQWKESERGECVAEWLQELTAMTVELSSATFISASDEIDPNELENVFEEMESLNTEPEWP